MVLERYLKKSGCYETVILSNKFMQALPESKRPISNVLFFRNFDLLKQFKTEIKRHVILSGQLTSFYALFNMSLAQFFSEN